MTIPSKRAVLVGGAMLAITVLSLGSYLLLTHNSKVHQDALVAAVGVFTALATGAAALAALLAASESSSTARRALEALRLTRRPKGRVLFEESTVVDVVMIFELEHDQSPVTRVIMRFDQAGRVHERQVALMSPGSVEHLVLPGLRNTETYNHTSQGNSWTVTVSDEAGVGRWQMGQDYDENAGEPRWVLLDDD